MRVKTERHEAVVTAIAVQFYSNSVTRYARVADQGIRGRTGASCRAGLLIPRVRGLYRIRGRGGDGGTSAHQECVYKTMQIT